MAGQPRHSHPGQEEKSGVVSQQMDMSPALFLRPANELVPWSQMPRGRRPRHTGNRRSPRIDQVLEVLTDRLGVGQVMMGLDQTAEEFLLRSAAHLPDLHWPQLINRGLDLFPPLLGQRSRW